MRKLFSLLIFLVLPCIAFSQYARYDQPILTINAPAPVAGNLYPAFALPLAGVVICNYPANGSYSNGTVTSACTNYASTYMTDTGGACPSNAQLTTPFSTSCSAQADSTGNFGVWTLPGNYDYEIVTSYGTYGPYPFVVVSNQLCALQQTVDITCFGAKPDLQNNSTASAGTGNIVTTTGNPTFVSTDVGKTISVAGNVSQIVTVNGPNSVTTASLISGGCVGSCVLLWGTNFTPAFQAANTFASQLALGAPIFVPPGSYLADGTPLVLSTNNMLSGNGQSNPVIYNGASTVSGGNFIAIGGGSPGLAGTTGVNGIALEMPFDASDCGISIATGTNWIIENNFFLSGGIALCLSGSDGLVTGNNFDSNIQKDISISGNGVDHDNTTHSILISHNMFWGAKYSCITISGTSDIQIIDNSFEFCYLHSIEGTTPIVTTRLSVVGNNFLTSTNSSFYSSAQTHIFFNTSGAGGLSNSIITNNVFSYSRQNDINIDGSGTTNNVIANNQFTASSLGSTSGNPLSSILITNVGAERTQILNNAWSNVGGYAVKSTSAIIKAIGNQFTGVFTLSGVPSTPNQSGAMYVSGFPGGESIVRNNSTADTTYPLFSADNASTNYTSNNLSGSAVCDVYVASNTAIKSTGERVCPAITFTAGVALGSSPGTISCINTCSPTSGYIQVLTVGSSPTTGIALTVNYNYGAFERNCTVQGYDVTVGGGPALNIELPNVTSTSMAIGLNTAPTTGHQLQFFYNCPLN